MRGVVDKFYINLEKDEIYEIYHNNILCCGDSNAPDDSGQIFRIQANPVSWLRRFRAGVKTQQNRQLPSLWRAFGLKTNAPSECSPSQTAEKYTF